MRIGIDVRCLSHNLMGGVHSYVANFVAALIELAREHEVWLYADTKCHLELPALPGRVTVKTLPWRGMAWTAYLDLFMARAMAKDRLDVVHFPANYGFGPARVPIVVTLHDAINLLPMREIVRGHRKTPKTIAMMTYLHYFTQASLRRASLVLTVSEHAKGEIVRVGRISPELVVPIHHGLAPDLKRIEDPSILAEVRARLRLPWRFVLADALKNPGVLIRAWRLLPTDLRDRSGLVFFSRTSSPPKAVLEAVEGREAMLLVRPSRPDLVALYSMAEAFVFPSWVEGFGIPVVEAMACGAPVIASNRGAIPEIAGGAALLCDAEDEEAFAGHIAAVMWDPIEAERLRDRGFSRARHFSWSSTAERVLDCYAEAAASPPASSIATPQVPG